MQVDGASLARLGTTTWFAVSALEHEGLKAMAKNERKGNREAKKPKKEKTAPAVAPGTPWSTLEKLKGQDRSKK
jgi:hypothetical protein